MTRWWDFCYFGVPKLAAFRYKRTATRAVLEEGVSLLLRAGPG